MTVRSFNAADRDVINLAASIPMAAIGGGPFTIAAIVKLADNGSGIYAAGGAPYWSGSAGADNTAGVSLEPAFDNWFALTSNGEFANLRPTVDDVETWVLMMVSKASGIATPRWHRYDCSAGSWTHGDAAKAIGDDTSNPVELAHIGQWSDKGTGNEGDFFTGRIAAVGVWGTTTSDSQAEALGLETSAQAWLDANPAGFWLLNQTSVSQPLVDHTRNGGDQTSISGTAIITGDDPPGFLADLPITAQFDGDTLPNLWEVDSPPGGETVTVSGGHVHIDMPAGTPYSGWDDNSEPDYSAGVERPVYSQDLDVAVQCSTDVSKTGWLGWGVMVRHGSDDDGAWFLFYQNGQSGPETRVFGYQRAAGAGGSSGNSSPPTSAPPFSGTYQWMRVTYIHATGVWTCWGSVDGLDWVLLQQAQRQVDIGRVKLLAYSGDSGAPGGTIRFRQIVDRLAARRVVDTFTDAAGVLLDAHTPDLGGTGVIEAMGFSDTDTAPTTDGVITSDAFAADTAGVSPVFRYNVDPGADEYDVHVRWSFGPSQAGEYHVLCWRMSDTGTTDSAVDRYMLVATAETNELQLWRVTGGSGSRVLLDSAPETLAGSVRRIRVEVRDAGMRVFIDGDPWLVSDDTSITARGRVGIGVSTGGGTFDQWADDLHVTLPGWTDTREPRFALAQVPVVAIDGTDGALPADVADDSADGGTITWTGTAMRMTIDRTVAGSRARLIWNGNQFRDCGLLVKFVYVNQNASTFFVPTLGVADGNPSDSFLAGPGYMFQAEGDNNRRVFRLDPLDLSASGLTDSDVPYERLYQDAANQQDVVQWARIERAGPRVRVRHWYDSDTEPTDWLWDGQDQVLDQLNLGWYMGLSHGGTGTGTVSVDVSSLTFYGLEGARFSGEGVMTATVAGGDSGIYQPGDVMMRAQLMTAEGLKPLAMSIKQ